MKIRNSQIKLLSAKVLITVCLILASSAFGQVKLKEIGAGIGGGQLFGNFTSQDVLSGSLSADFSIENFDEFDIALEMFYAQKLERFLPEDRTGRYYPFVSGFSANVNFFQSVATNLFVEEWVGILAINNNIIETQPEWNFGLSFAAITGIELGESNETRWRLFAAAKASQTFTKSTPGSFRFELGASYYFRK